MQANDINNDSEHLLVTQEGDVRGLENTVHELDQIRAEALRDIDEGGFSCVAKVSLSLSRSSPIHRHGTFTAGFILNYA
jgi:hypothetical protein